MMSELMAWLRVSGAERSAGAGAGYTDSTVRMSGSHYEGGRRSERARHAGSHAGNAE